jgi:hypothetical protein
MMMPARPVRGLIIRKARRAARAANDYGCGEFGAGRVLSQLEHGDGPGQLPGLWCIGHRAVSMEISATSGAMAAQRRLARLHPSVSNAVTHDLVNPLRKETS